MLDRFTRRWAANQQRLTLGKGERREVVGVPSDHFQTAPGSMSEKDIKRALRKVRAEMARRRES